MKTVTGCLLALLALRAVAAESVASEARDTAAAFVATQNFVVGRIGRDCLEELGRSETAAEYQKRWQRDNARYHAAAMAYLEARLAELEDPLERDDLERAFYGSVNARGEAAARQLMNQGEKADVCRHAIALVDGGKMDIEAFVEATGQPIMPSLNGLAEWAKSR